MVRSRSPVQIWASAQKILKETGRSLFAPVPYLRRPPWSPMFLLLDDRIGHMGMKESATDDHNTNWYPDRYLGRQ